MMKVVEIRHTRGGELLWEAENLYNTLHVQGEQYFLGVLFGGTPLPANYYMGLDARPTIAVADTMASIVDEPTSHGYLRQFVNATSGWNIQLVGGVYTAIGGIITFTASGGSWGPMSTLFLTNRIDNAGVLLSSVPLPQALTVSSGDSVSMRMSQSLRDYPV